MHSASPAVRHYDGLSVSGSGFAPSYCGLPDIGFVAWPDTVAFVERLPGALPDVHLLADIDDGYAGTGVTCHVVRRLERCGAPGIVREDRSRPRRCGHAEGRQVLPLDTYPVKLTGSSTAGATCSWWPAPTPWRPPRSSAGRPPSPRPAPASSWSTACARSTRSAGSAT